MVSIEQKTSVGRGPRLFQINCHDHIVNGTKVVFDHARTELREEICLIERREVASIICQPL